MTIEKRTPDLLTPSTTFYDVWRKREPRHMRLSGTDGLNKFLGSLVKEHSASVRFTGKIWTKSLKILGLNYILPKILFDLRDPEVKFEYHKDISISPYKATSSQAQNKLRQKFGRSSDCRFARFFHFRRLPSVFRDDWRGKFWLAVEFAGQSGKVVFQAFPTSFPGYSEISWPPHAGLG